MIDFEAKPLETSDIAWETMTSVTGRQWIVSDPKLMAVQQLINHCGLSTTLATILTKRGFNLDEAKIFLNPTLGDLLVDPYTLLDMDKAVERTVYALTNCPQSLTQDLDQSSSSPKSITIYGDYDVDGACSSALLRCYFRDLGVETGLYIPDRLKEGYGPNTQALLSLRAQGTDLVIMVDCGTTAYDPLTAAQDVGLDIIVLDHHLSQHTLPPAIAIVNPNRVDQGLGDRVDLKDLCAAGVTFLFLIALQQRLKTIGFVPPSEGGYPDLRQYLDIVALATVCDVMPMRGLNRALITVGLKVLNKRLRPGLVGLGKVAGVTEEEVFKAYHLGFVLGPRINAGGRIGQSDLGSRLLFSNDYLHVSSIATALHTYNQERQAIEARVLEESLAQVDALKLNKEPFILVAGHGWHPGVIGIVAGRLKEQFHKPAAVVSLDDDGIGKGSGRSVFGLDLGSLIHESVNNGLLVAGGGHTMAVGFTVSSQTLDGFNEFLKKMTAQKLGEQRPRLIIDGFLGVGAMNSRLLNDLNTLEPYGQGNPTPKFAVYPVRIGYSDIVGKNHIRVTLEDERNGRLKAIAFRSLGSDLGDILLRGHGLGGQKGQWFAMAGTLKENTWQGKKSITFIIDDCMAV